MTYSDPAATAEHFASRLDDQHLQLSRQWLDRLDALLSVDRGEVFPTPQLLDHIPDLIREIASYLRAPEHEEIVANTAVMAKAAELGLLRFDQRASVHQLLREYQILGAILDDFFIREASALGSGGDAGQAARALSRATQAVRVLQQKTVDAFISRYMETIERQTAQLRNFCRLVSHEIRQPLGVLQVLSRVVAANGADDEQQQLMATLERNVVRLGEVATNLERLARLTRRSESLPNEQVVQLSAVVQDVARQLVDMADARSVTFDIDDHLPSIAADAGRVELVIINVLANAVKYSDPDKPARVVRVESDPQGAGPRLQIRDNGIGIPAAKLQSIFDQFVRVHAHLDDELGAQGMGLGLSIVRESMEAMGGSVTVVSTEGEGTTFTLEWPSPIQRDTRGT